MTSEQVKKNKLIDSARFMLTINRLAECFIQSDLYLDHGIFDCELRIVLSCKKIQCAVYAHALIKIPKI